MARVVGDVLVHQAPESFDRVEVRAVGRDGLARRANALALLDDGMSCEAIAKVLLLDDDTIRTWYRLYEEDGIEGLATFGYEGGACRLSEEQQDRLKVWISDTLPRTTREVGAWIEKECGIEYQGRSGLIALLHRLGMEPLQSPFMAARFPKRAVLRVTSAWRKGSSTRCGCWTIIRSLSAGHPKNAWSASAVTSCWARVRSHAIEEAPQRSTARRRPPPSVVARCCR
jgi:transposase